MKKVLILSFLIFATTVNASRTYLFNDKNDYSTNIITNNDNYNYGDYILEQNQVLVIPPENGIIFNDIIKSMDYKIKILENSKNSNINDLEYNETTGSLTYSPSNDVTGDVSFKYYVEYNNQKSNESYIYFYVKSTTTNYQINFYEKNSNTKVLPSIEKESKVNALITEKAVKLDEYKSINEEITKKINLNSKNNNFDFYYEKIPNTGI